MSKLFLISDTHFFHQNIIKFEQEYRPFASIEEMHEKLIDNWNSVVSRRDTVYHLGDVCFGRKDNLSILDSLNGNKKLVMGNHDYHEAEEYNKYFSSIGGVRELDGYILSHIPVHPDQFYRYKGSIHGHLHSTCLEDSRYFNVSCERIGLTPILWEEVKAKMEKANA